MAATVKKTDMAAAADSLRLVVEKTKGLPEDTSKDAALRERLELAADVLDASAS